MPENQTGYEVKINGTKYEHFSGITINRDYTQFVDTFSLDFNNPFGRYSTRIPIGGIASIYYNGVEIFRGLIEDKSTIIKEIGSTIKFSGREEFVDFSEDEADPTLGTFKNITDNEIISKVAGANSFSWILGDARKIKEYAISASGVTKGQVIQDVLRFNDFVLIKKGNLITKTRIPSASGKNTGSSINLTIQGGKMEMLETRVMTVSIDESIRSVRSKIGGFAYEKSKTKKQLASEFENLSISSGGYANRVRNGSGLMGKKINRIKYLSESAKEKGELDKQVKRALIETDVSGKISVTLAGAVPFDLLEIVKVNIEQELIFQYMFISNITYSFDSTNKKTTVVGLSVFPYVTL